MDLEGRVAVVTGGGVRVGKALALGLAAAGADVFVHYGRSAGPAADTATKAEALGVRAAVGSVDLSVPQDSARVIDLAEQALGPVSVLLNSASGFSENTIEDVGFDAWQQTLDVTLSAPVFLTKAFADRLPLEMSGAVVNVTDVRTATPNLRHFSYIVAKGGIDAFTRAAAAGLAPRIRVNAVALGVILPDKDSYSERLATKLPLARVGGTEPVVDTVLFLLRNDFVTGEIVRVDGGGHLT